MQMPLEVVFSEIEKCEWTMFDMDDVRTFISHQAGRLDDDSINALFDDLFAFNAYLGRIEGYPSFEKVPFWEYSTCLEWCDSHMMVGDSFDLTLSNAKRFLSNIKKYFSYLSAESFPIDTTEIDKAIKTICGDKKLKLVTDIPYTGDETYTEIYKGGVGIRFDMADYWLLILKTTQYEEKWAKLLEAALKVSKERVAKVKDLQTRMTKAGYVGLGDIAYNDVTGADTDKARDWFLKP
jgi:hypothetical protein